MNQRKKTGLVFLIIILFLVGTAILGIGTKEEAMLTDFGRKNLSPCMSYLFGTDWLGRDMLARTLTGLSLSIRIGLLAAGISAVIALVLGISAVIGGKTVDTVISFVIDALMGVPHILLLLLVSYALGKGFKGVVLGVALTHWPSLARLIRAEVLQLKSSTYIQIAYRLGHSKIKVAIRHMLPHLLPQFLVGFVLLFPHAILHEAAITFLGFGLPSEQPAIGIILSESMKYLITGKWWLAVFPGIMLVITVILFDIAGNSLRRLIDPQTVHK